MTQPVLGLMGTDSLPESSYSSHEASPAGNPHGADENTEEERS